MENADPLPHESEHVPRHRLSRRDVVAGIAAAMTAGMPARAEVAESSDIYFVPGGRIGFQRPADITPRTSTWHLLSSDQTLQVEVREALRIDADWDDRIWQPDRHVLVAFDFLSPGIEHRHFHDQRSGHDADYGADTHVFRDDHWIGQIWVSTSTLGSPFLSTPGGQIARWKGVMDALVASLTIRPSPPVPQALAELRVDLSVESLNPRFVGDQLVLSLLPPATPQEVSGIRGSHILLPQLSLSPAGRPEQLEQAANEAFAIYQGMTGTRVISGPNCRAVVLHENRSSDDNFATTVMAFGRTRQLKLTAFYNAGDRGQMLQTLERVVLSLRLPDGQ